jgi:hypothetical protein
MLSAVLATTVFACFLFNARGVSVSSAATQSTPANIQVLLQIGKSTMLVNGASQQLDPGQGTAPIIVDGRTFLPIRAIIEAFSGTVGWDGTDQKATISLGSNTIVLHIGSMAATVNGNASQLDAAPFISDTGRTMLPLRFVSENLGLNVDWNAGTQAITISGATGGSGSQTSTGSQSGTKLTIPSGKFIASPNFKNNLIIPAGSGTAPGKFYKGLVNILPFLKINPSLETGLLHGLLGTSNPTPRVLEDVVSDKKLAGVSYLGHGYDLITGNYADSESVKDYQILDTDKLLNAGLVLQMPNSQSYSTFASGESAQSYSEQLATSVGVSGSYLFFSGSVKTNFSSDSLSQTNSSFATLSYVASQYDLYIDQQHAKLTDYLDPAFAQAINDPGVDPDWIFDRYGTHVLLSERMGGRLDYNASANSTYTEQEHDMQADMDASFNLMYASANVNVSTSQKTASSSYTQNSTTNIKAYPAYGSGSLDPSAFAAWFQSMQSNPTLSDFGQDPFVPVWQLATDPVRQQQIETAFAAWGNSHDYVPAPHSYVITGIRLIHAYTVGDAEAGNIPDQFVDPQTNDTWQQIANIGAHTMDPGDGLTVVYVRYGWADETPPVVGIFFTNENNGFSPDSVDYAFQQMFGNDPTAKVWGYGHDELPSSGQDTYVTTSMGDKMRLYYVTGMNEPPFVHLRVRWLNPDGSTGYAPAQQPTDPAFFPVIDASVFLGTSLGQAVPQNCDADLGNVEVMNSDIYPLINHHYIEYAYQ